MRWWSKRLGGFCLLCSIAALGLFARERDRGAHTLANKIHQTGNNPLIRVDSSAAQYFATVAGPRPAGDLLWTVSVFLVVCDCVIQCSKHHGSEKFPRAVALLIVECGAINEIFQLVVLSLFLLLSFGVRTF